MHAEVLQRETAWLLHRSPLKRPALTQDLVTDVCVIGGGIAGLTTAYLLSDEGRSVIVLEAGDLGRGETVRTTAHLSNAIDDRYFRIEEVHGAEGARLCAESHTQAITTVEAIVEEEKIDCGFKRLDGYLFLPPGESESVLDKELEAAHRAGLRDVEKLPHTPWSAYPLGPCLRFPSQAQFHPLSYLEGLARGIENRGGQIFTDTRVIEIEDLQPLLVRTRGGFFVRANDVVMATNTPFIDRLVMHTKQAAYRTYVIAGRVPSGSVTEALYWDTSDTPGDRSAPYHYVRVHSEAQDEELKRLENEGGSTDVPIGQDLLIVGGEDHKTGQADDADERWNRLERWTRTRFPMMEEIQYRWSGQVLEPVDGIAFIGRNPIGPNHVYIATGDSGMGMTHGTIAGILITDLILGRENAWEKLYDPARKSIRSLGEFAKENLNVAAQFGDWFKSGDVNSVHEIAPGQGALVRSGLKLVAAYRDSDGCLHERSAICPHLGCVVAWNTAENSWDCPCHGSRFDPYGAVLNGPAKDCLAFTHTEAVVAVT